MQVRGLSILLIGGVIATVAIYAGSLIYFTWPISEVSVDKSGVFGDSFGLLTSLFSGLAFAGLIITIVMQKDELALQREELSLTRSELSEQKEELKVQNETMRVQRFENTFFRMLELLQACRNDIIYRDWQSNSSWQGRDAIKKIYKSFVDGYLHGHNNVNGIMIPFFKGDSKTIQGVKAEYRRFYEEESGEGLGQYYRTLYNILKLVEKNEAITDKKVYTNLLRAQLSKFELSLLFYNCLSEYGESKMLPLVKKYSILKHLEASSLPEENVEIWRLFNA